VVSICWISPVVNPVADAHDVSLGEKFFLVVRLDDECVDLDGDDEAEWIFFENTLSRVDLSIRT
jgi:hypothetical protein